MASRLLSSSTKRLRLLNVTTALQVLRSAVFCSFRSRRRVPVALPVVEYLRF